MILFYIRHGDPIYHPDSLTELGESQAEAVARRLALFGVDEVYSSPSNRAMLTAKPTCVLLGREMKILDFLNENELGGIRVPLGDSSDWIWSHPDFSQRLTGREMRELGERWYEHPDLKDYHFERTIQPINEQLDAFIASLGYEHDTNKGLYKITTADTEKRVAIFAHECIGKLVMSHLLDVPFPYYAQRFEMHTSGMTVIRFDNREIVYGREHTHEYARAQMLTLSNDSHLYKDGISLEHRFTHIRVPY